MYCINANLTDPPRTNHMYVKELFLNENKFKVLRKDMFVSKIRADIELLSLQYCEISNVSDGVFSGLKMLKDLNLEFNYITEIRVGTFRNLFMLENLHMPDNEITELSEGIFDDLFSLKSLDLSFNKISYIERNVFSYNSNLSSLSLRVNRLSRIDSTTFEPLIRLEELYLGFNKDLHIPYNSSLLNVPTLKYLDLSHCNLSSAPDNWFQNLGQLQHLRLHDNKLKGIDINVLVNLPSLKTLYLFNNPLQCDCQLLDVWKWCSEHHIKTEENAFPACSTPEEVKGILWGILENSNCSDNKIKFLDNNQAILSEEVDKYERDNPIYGKVFVIVLFLLPLLGIIGNVVVLIAIIANPEMHTLPNSFILNLALSDLLFLLLSLFFKLLVYFSEKWNIVDFTCNFEVIVIICLGSSTFSVTVLSINRYYVVANPFKIRTDYRKMRMFTYLCIPGTWVLAFIFSIPYIIVSYYSLECIPGHKTLYNTYVLIFLTLAFSVFPFCVIGSMYVLLARHLVCSRRIGANCSRKPQRFGSVGVVVGLVIVFLFSIMPYYIVMLYLDVLQHLDVITFAYLLQITPNEQLQIIDSQQPLLPISRLLLPYLNACCNPIALCFASKRFRNYFKKYLLCCCKCRPNIENGVTQLH
ncbi:uncharacterized protein [Periplaneta americana]|uniref:uncharacterized protein n=1 Tax=Periplaneta americana TaxID=6978 RepID=UPI0037E95705